MSSPTLPFLFGGPVTSTNGTSSSQTQGTNLTSQLGTNLGSNSTSFQNVTTPNLPSWYSTFLSSIPQQMQSLYSSVNQNAQKPLYGAPQQAAFQQNLNQTQGQGLQALNSQLASMGALNSGRAAQNQTQTFLNGQNQLSNYLANVPLLNSQNQLSQNQLLNSINGQAAGFTSPISAFGSTQTGNQTGLTQLLTSLLGSNTSNTSTSGGGITNGQTTPNVLGSLLTGGLGQLLTQLLGGGGAAVNPTAGGTTGATNPGDPSNVYGNPNSFGGIGTGGTSLPGSSTLPGGNNSGAPAGTPSILQNPINPSTGLPYPSGTPSTGGGTDDSGGSYDSNGNYIPPDPGVNSGGSSPGAGDPGLSGPGDMFGGGASITPSALGNTAQLNNSYLYNLLRQAGVLQ